MSEYNSSSMKKISSQIDSNTHSKVRESNTLKLRKSKLTSYLMNSHLKEIKTILMNDSDYEIKINTLQLTPEFLSEYKSSETKLSFALNNLSSSDINIAKFSLCQMHKYFKETTYDSIERLILSSTIKDLSNLLFIYSQKDKGICYEIIWLLIQFSIHSKSLIYLIATESVILVLFGVLTSPMIDYCLMNNVLLLFSNWLTDEKLFTLITEKSNIAGFLFKSIQTSEKCNFPMAFINNCLRTLCLLIDEYSFPLLKVYIEKSLKCISNFVISNLNQEVFQTALNLLNEIFNHANKDDIAYDVIEDIGLIGLIAQHIYQEDIEEEVMQTCFSILINLTFIDSSYISRLIFDTLLLNKVQSILEQIEQDNLKHKALLSSIISLIQNLISLNSTMQFIFKNTAIFKPLIALLQKDISKDDYQGILLLLENIMQSTNKALYLEAFYLDIPKKVLLPTLNSTRDEESKSKCLSIAEVLLAFGENLIPGQNCVKRKFDQIGLSSIIESFVNCNNKNLSERAEHLQKYFQ